jgi:hypothetical protein
MKNFIFAALFVSILSSCSTETPKSTEETSTQDSTIVKPTQVDSPKVQSETVTH